MPCWVNGVPAEAVSVRDRGLAYGDGVFETIAVRHCKAALLDRHLRRLLDGCRRLLIPMDEQLLREEVSAFIGQLADGVVKVLITRGDGLRGYALPEPQHPVRMLMSSALPAYSVVNCEQGIRLFPCATRLAEQPLLAGLKHLNRLEQVLARAEWTDPIFAEGLLRDQSGRVIEGVFSNLFLVRDGRLLTPDLSRCGVAGVMRAELIERATLLGIEVCIQDVTYAQLLAADEVFVCNSIYGIWPVCQLADQLWSRGSLTRKLQDNVHDLSGS
ncbi:MAG TPA: aminodeoxychorismate lyase [Pseudomonas sp.]|nr:aminodeoxychorismate lyase [Pseudomonas sp.]